MTLEEWIQEYIDEQHELIEEAQQEKEDFITLLNEGA